MNWGEVLLNDLYEVKYEMKLAADIMKSPAWNCDSADEKVGAYKATHRAATIVLEGIVDSLDEIIKIKEEE